MRRPSADDGCPAPRHTEGCSYTWADADPHLAEFRRWVPETPGLPDRANALLKAREKALKKQDDAEDARELRKELARLGVVRDEDKRQCWRLPSR